MTTSVLVQVSVGALTFIVSVLNFLNSRGGRRARIKSDLDIAKLLPEGDPVQLQLVDRSRSAIELLIKDEDEKTRDPFGIGLALVLITTAVSAAIVLVPANLFYLFLVVPVVLLGSVGLNRDAVLRRRDERGRPIESK